MKYGDQFQDLKWAENSFVERYSLWLISNTSHIVTVLTIMTNLNHSLLSTLVEISKWHPKNLQAKKEKKRLNLEF